MICASGGEAIAAIKALIKFATYSRQVLTTSFGKHPRLWDWNKCQDPWFCRRQAIKHSVLFLHFYLFVQYMKLWRINLVICRIHCKQGCLDGC